MSTVKVMGWTSSVLLVCLGCFILCLAQGKCKFCVPQCLTNWHAERVSRINTENLRSCIERDFWYNNALGRLTNRGTRPEDQIENEGTDTNPDQIDSAPQETPPPPLPKKSVYVMTKAIDIPIN